MFWEASYCSFSWSSGYPDQFVLSPSAQSSPVLQFSSAQHSPAQHSTAVSSSQPALPLSSEPQLFHLHLTNCWMLSAVQLISLVHSGSQHTVGKNYLNRKTPQVEHKLHTKAVDEGLHEGCCKSLFPDTFPHFFTVHVLGDWLIFQL